MTKNQDVRWRQRFSNFNKALAQLTKFIEKGKLSELEKQGLIQSFEYTYELSWNLMKDIYEEQGESGIQGSKDAFRLAFKRGLIADGQAWMNMVEDRKLTSHTYDEETAEKVVVAIQKDYFSLFVALQKRLMAVG